MDIQTKQTHPRLAEHHGHLLFHQIREIRYWCVLIRKILLNKPVIRIALLVQICQYHYLQSQTMATVILIVVPVAVILIVVPVAVILMTIVGGTTGAAIKDLMGTTGAAIEDSVDLMGTTGAAIEDSVDLMGTHSKMISALSLNNIKIQHGYLRQ